MTTKQYADRDHMELGDFYVRHVSAMTAEGLHAKSDIAAELAWRDREIERMKDALKKANSQAEHFEREWYLRGDEIESLQAQLAAIGAGGVEPLRRRECLHQIAEPAQAAPAAVAGPSLYQVMAVAKAIHTTTPDADDWDSLRQWEVDALRRRAEKVLAALAGSQAHFACPQCKAAPAAVAGPTPDGLLGDDGENRAVRMFLAAYGTPGLTVATMRRHMELAGWTQSPAWTTKPDAQGHLTKSGAQSWLRHLFALEASIPTTQPAPVAQGDALLSIAEKYGRVLIERCRVGSTSGPVRWDIEYGYNDKQVRGSTLLAAIDAARAQAKEGQSHE